MVVFENNAFNSFPVSISDTSIFTVDDSLLVKLNVNDMIGEELLYDAKIESIDNFNSSIIVKTLLIGGGERQLGEHELTVTTLGHVVLSKGMCLVKTTVSMTPNINGIIVT